MNWEEFFVNFSDKYLRFHDERYLRKISIEIYIILMIVIPFSLLLYILFSKGKHKILIDLGRGHKWLIK